MTISSVTFETPLDMREEIEAVRRDGVKVEGILLQDFVITFDWNGARWRFTGPKGNASAPSIPWWLRSIVSVAGPSKWAAVHHDFGYENHSMPRSDLDELYVVIMNGTDAGLWDRAWSWLGIRFGGWLPYNRHEGERTLIGLVKVEEIQP